MTEQAEGRTEEKTARTQLCEQALSESFDRWFFVYREEVDGLVRGRQSRRWDEQVSGTLIAGMRCEANLTWGILCSSVTYAAATPH